MIAGIQEADFQRQIDRILESRLFTANPSHVRLLKYLAENTIARLKITEGDIARAMHNKEAWEVGSLLRVNRTRLRELIDEYYAGEGCNDAIRIDVVRRAVVPKRNRESYPTLAQIDALSPELAAALTNFYTSPEQPKVRCVVTGEPDNARWHLLDFDVYNVSLAKTIPLCLRLTSHLRALNDDPTRTMLPELAPSHLAGVLAPKHYGSWRVWDAYACSALAFYLGSPRFCNEPKSVRLLRLCDAIHYVRHRFFEPLIYQIIVQIASPFVTALDSIERRSALRLAIQLTALMEEACVYDLADKALTIAMNLARRSPQRNSKQAAQQAFTLIRRGTQLPAEVNPFDHQFDDAIREAKDHIDGFADRALTLEVVRIQRWLRQNTPDALRHVYEALAPLIETYSPLFVDDDFLKPSEVAAADLSEIFLLFSIVCSRLKPSRWKSLVEEQAPRAKAVMYQGGHSLPTEYATFLSQTGASANHLLQISPTQIRRPLRIETIGSVTVILDHLKQIPVFDSDNLGL